MIPTQQGKIDSTLADQFETENFKLELTSKTFSVLFDTLYQDKITSPMREICTNAFDSHTVAGKHIPFRVQLPTRLDPTFSVRDYGTGLSKADVMGLYTTAFGTTKDATNDQVGYLGLGSKSFFAYTDSAMVSSWFEGEQSNYICSLNEQRIPQISHVSSSPSTEPNGFKVSYSVKSMDVTAFHAAASKVLAGFRGYDIYPEFNAEVKVEAPKVVYTSDEIVISEIMGSYTYQARKTKKFNIRQGCVIYPVDGIDIDWIVGGHEITITVPIGTVEVAASRESLSLDATTSQRVKEIAKEAKEKLDREVKDTLDKSSTYLQACIEFYSKMAPWRNMSEGSGILWNGREIKRRILVPSSTPVSNPPGVITATGVGPVAAPQPIPVVPIRLTGAATKNAWHIQQLDVTSIPNIKIATIAPDEKVLRQKLRFEDHSGCDYLIRDFDDDKKKALMEALELREDQFIPFSQIPDPGPKPSTSSVKSKDANGNTLIMPYIFRNRYSWTQDSLPDNAEYFWLPTDKKYGRIEIECKQRYSSTMGVTGFTPSHYDTQAKVYFNSLALPMPGLPSRPYLMTPSVRKKANPDPNNRLDVAIRRFIKENEKEIVKNLAIQILKRKLSIDEVQLDDLGITSVFTTTISSDMLAWIMYPDSSAAMAEKVNTLVEATTSKYPLLFGEQSLEDIQEYILFANKKKRKK